MAKRKIAKANRGFKGVWIPASYWLDENLSVQEMLFLVEIDSLDDEKGCYASNKHFSDFFGLSKSRVSEIINSLLNKNYISIDYKYKGKEVDKRVIKVFGKSKGGIRDSEGGYSGNTKGSNTSLSNTSLENHMSGKPDSIPYSDIIKYLNEKVDRSFKVTNKWKDLIKARWNEGQRYDDFIKVIDVKTSQWLQDPKMSNYLRPETLFSNKFDSYLNEQLEPERESNSNSPVVF